MNRLNLYFVMRHTDWGYDRYDSFVICCKNEYVARHTHPCESYKWYEKKGSRGDWVSKSEINGLNVIHLGQANAGIKNGVVLASFNAG